MDSPEHDIGGVITALCQGSKAEQAAALQRYFTEDAHFTHPFCRVPSFSGIKIPFINENFNSRWLIMLIYQWYRILSPHIDFEIESKVYDQRTKRLYLTIHQVFTIWFIPFSLWQSHVSLVTVLYLDHLPADGNNHGVIAGRKSITTDDLTGTTLWYIRGQEDLYQVNEFVKFVAPWGASVLWYGWQILATLASALGVFVFWPVTAIHDHLSQEVATWRKPGKNQ
ncbi:hypothetical protein BX600DRAFT_504654 [Xylariales sp. PMI_506]|nr:hypothetical protein BX600DRAFT_504654 [Xylariales sp. PMI_506]